ncbi:MAG TPA: hypothetical protein VFZ08_03025 [Terriglobia bacterium]|nr:hypothetical protein [Terriglobia bacterium]
MKSRKVTRRTLRYPASATLSRRERADKNWTRQKAEVEIQNFNFKMQDAKCKMQNAKDGVGVATVSVFSDRGLLSQIPTAQKSFRRYPAFNCDKQQPTVNQKAIDRGYPWSGDVPIAEGSQKPAARTPPLQRTPPPWRNHFQMAPLPTAASSWVRGGACVNIRRLSVRRLKTFISVGNDADCA